MAIARIVFGFIVFFIASTCSAQQVFKGNTVEGILYCAPGYSCSCADTCEVCIITRKEGTLRNKNGYVQVYNFCRWIWLNDKEGKRIPWSKKPW